MPDVTNLPPPSPPTEGALDLQRTLLIGLHLAGQLSDIHRRGEIHGGVSPVVVDIDPDGRVTLLPLTPDTPRDQRYDAPEIVAGGEPTVQSDISGVGATLAAVTLGRAPLRNASHAIDIYGHGVDAGLCNVIDAATAPDPLDRYESAEELISELRVVESRHGFVPTVINPPAAAQPRHRDQARSRRRDARTMPRSRPRARHAAIAISSAAALLISGAVIGPGTAGTAGRTAALPSAAASRLPSEATSTPGSTSETATSERSPSTTQRPAGNVPAEQSGVTAAEAETLITAERETVPAIPTTVAATTPPAQAPTTGAPASSTPARLEAPSSTAVTPPTNPTGTTPTTPEPTTPSTVISAPTTTPPPTTAVPTTTAPAPPTTRPAPPTTQPAPTTTVAPVKPPRVGQINAWKNPDDSGTWAFGAPEADRCAVARWELRGPVSTSTTKDPRNSAGATNGCFDDVQRFNTYFSNVALDAGDYTITLTITNVTTGLSASNSASFTVR